MSEELLNEQEVQLRRALWETLEQHARAEGYSHVVVFSALLALVGMAIHDGYERGIFNLERARELRDTMAERLAALPLGDPEAPRFLAPLPQPHWKAERHNDSPSAGSL